MSTDSGAVPIVATTGRPGLSDYIIASPTIEEFVAFRCAFVMIIVNTRSLPAIEKLLPSVFFIIMIIDHTPGSFDNTFLIDLDILDPPPMGVFTSDISARFKSFRGIFLHFLHLKFLFCLSFSLHYLLERSDTHRDQSLLEILSHLKEILPPIHFCLIIIFTRI